MSVFAAFMLQTESIGRTFCSRTYLLVNVGDVRAISSRPVDMLAMEKYSVPEYVSHPR
jgi:hypothetical protein